MKTYPGPQPERLLQEVSNSPGSQCRAVKRNFLGIELSVVSRAALIEIFRDSMRARSKLTISFLNPNIAVYAHRNHEVMQFMNSFDVVLPDGIGVVWGARFLGIPVPERLGNDDIGADIFNVCASEGYGNFFFGSKPGVVERAAANLQRSFPRLRISGTLHGYWFDLSPGNPDSCKSQDNEAILQQVNTSRADVLWVGLSTPLQQRWVYENRHRIDANVVITSGGYLDHLAERVEWYPPLFYHLRLLWLYRLLREPRRLWRRYSIEMIVFASLLMKGKTRSSQNGQSL